VYASPNPSLQHAGIYTDQNVTGWMMSEKLDGIRGYWDGSAIYTKSGKRLFVPSGFTKNFPPFALDGELWSRRQDFEAIQSEVLRHGGNWKKIGYYIFEVPYAKGGFTQRLNSAEEWFRRHPNPHVMIIKQTVCKSPQHLKEFLDAVVAKGGEGVMVKDPAPGYIPGRTSSLLKVKKAHDMEGTVISVTTDKTTGEFKSLTLELGNGIRFRLGNGFSDQERENPPPVGSVVTFKHYGFTKKGKPKFASFLRIRKE
jgi:DNA ligase-1